VQVYALTSSQSLHETLDLFLSREAADAELREILEDEPDLKDVLRSWRSNSTGGTCRRIRGTSLPANSSVRTATVALEMLGWRGQPASLFARIAAQTDAEDTPKPLGWCGPILK
jgi:hypothetical protein